MSESGNPFGVGFAHPKSSGRNNNGIDGRIAVGVIATAVTAASIWGIVHLTRSMARNEFINKETELETTMRSQSARIGELELQLSSAAAQSNSWMSRFNSERGYTQNLESALRHAGMDPISAIRNSQRKRESFVRKQ